MTIDDVTGGAFKVGNTTYNMVEAKYNGVVVWPTSQPVVTTYVVVASSVYYIFSNSGNILLASGSNYAEVYGNVLVQEDGVTVDTLYDVRLNVALPSGSPFRIDNNRIFGYNLGGTEKAQQESIVKVTYSTSASADATTKIYQEANVDTQSTVVGQKIYDHTQDAITYRDYGMSFSANRYTSDIAGGRCPANGGSATLSLSAWHWEDVYTPWTQTTTTTHSFTSGYEYSESNVASGTELTDSDKIWDNPSISGSTTGFSRNGLAVTIASYLTQSWHWDEGRSVTYTATVTKHDNTTLSSAVTLYQDPDSYSSEDDTTATERTWDSTTSTTNDQYSVTITISQYNTSSSPCPASGGFAGFGVGASHRETVTRGYTDATTITHHWVSGRTTSELPTIETGTAIESQQTVSDTPSISIPSSAQSWLSYDAENNRLVFASRGTSTGSARNATVTATNGDATDSVTVYQEANSRSMSFIYNIVLELQHQGNLPGDAGRYAVAYTSERTLRYTYTSGEHTDETNPYTTNVVSSAAYCEPSVSSVSGTGVFYIDVEQNPSSSQTRSFTLRLSGQSSSSQPLSITQEAYVPAVQDVATLEPIMFSVDTGPYLRGKVYYLFTIDSGAVTSSTLTGVNFCYRVNDGAKQTVQIGSFPVSETSQPTALQPSGVTIPTFSSGTVKAWFEVTGSTGDFDSINAGEEDHSITITF